MAKIRIGNKTKQGVYKNVVLDIGREVKIGLGYVDDTPLEQSAYGSENAKRSAGGFHSTVLVVVFRWSVAGGSLPGVGLSYFVFVSSGLERTGRLRRFASSRR